MCLYVYFNYTFWNWGHNHKMGSGTHWTYCEMDLISISFYSFFFFLKLSIFKKFYLFLAALGLCYCARAFSSCGEWGLLFVQVRGLLIVVASLVAEHGF